MKEHKLSLLSAILLNMNIMVGSGILIGAGQAAAVAGNASFLGWIVVFLCFLPLVLSVIQLSTLFPTAAGMHIYAKEGLGSKAGFISAWLYVTGYTFTAVVECLALRDTLAIATSHYWLFDSPILFNTLLMLIICAINLASMKLISRFLNSLTIIKLLPLIILIVLIPFIFNPSFTVTTTELAALPFSLPLLIFGFFGFEYCTSFSHMIENSEKNAPKAILLGFLATALIYSLFHFGVLNLMGAQNLSTYQASSFANFLHLPIPGLVPLLKLLIPVATAITLFAVCLGAMNSNAMLLNSLGQQRILAGSSALAKTTSLGRPWFTIILQCLIVFTVATLIPSIPLAGGLCILAVFSSFVLPLVSLIVVLKKKGLKNKLPIAYAGFIALMCFVAYSWYSLAETMAGRMQYSLILVGVLALGFALLRKKD